MIPVRWKPPPEAARDTRTPSVPADIHHFRDVGKIIGRENRRRLLGRVPAHGLMEQRRGRRVVVQIVIQGLAVGVVECRPTGLHAVEHAAIGSPKPLLTVEERQAALGPDCVGLQGFGKRGQGEGSIVRLGKEAEIGQGTKQAMERLGLGTDRVRQLLWRLRPVLQAIGQTKLCRDIDELGDAEAHDELSQRRGRCRSRQRFLGRRFVHPRGSLCDERLAGMRLTAVLVAVDRLILLLLRRGLLGWADEKSGLFVATLLRMTFGVNSVRE